jgi:hypothetical protein
MPHPAHPTKPQQSLRLAIPEICQGAGRRAPAIGSELMSDSVQDSDLRASDYQHPLPDSSGHDRTPRLTRVDTSQRCVLVPDVDGCFR